MQRTTPVSHVFGQDLPRVLPDFFDSYHSWIELAQKKIQDAADPRLALLCRNQSASEPRRMDGAGSDLPGQGVTFFPEMRHDPEQLGDRFGVGIRAGVPYLSGRKDP